MSSLSEADSFAIQWMNEHFDHYGDKQPNGIYNMLSVSTKAEMYDSYVADIFVIGVVKAVSSQRFVELWLALFPYVRLRAWVSIPGKCKTCLMIDKLRRTESDKNVQIALKHAHHLHRGGLFMLERQRYNKILFLIK